MTKDKGVRVWVGYSDGKPNVYRDDRVHPAGVRLVAVYPSRAAARLEYSDVRPMRMIREAGK